MEYKIEPQEGYLYIEMDGNVLNAVQNDAFFQEVQEKLEASKHTNGLLDLSDVDYMNSTGISLTMRLHSKFANQGGKLVIVSPHDSVNKVFHITKLDGILDIEDSSDQATAKF